MSEPILSSIDLADLRQLSESSLPHLARVLTPTLARQPGGVTALVFPTPGSVPYVRCRVQQATAEVIAAFRADAFTTAPLRVVAFALDEVSELQLMIGTQILVTGETNGAAWTLALDVIGVQPQHSYQTQRRALCVPSTVAAA